MWRSCCTLAHGGVAGSSIAKSVFFPSKEEWVVALQQALPDHELLSHETLAATHIAVFVKKELLPYVSRVEHGSVATGIANTIGNKGGVAVSCSLGATSFLFVNAHFAAHQNNVPELREGVRMKR